MRLYFRIAPAAKLVAAFFAYFARFLTTGGRGVLVSVRWTPLFAGDSPPGAWDEKSCPFREWSFLFSLLFSTFSVRPSAVARRGGSFIFSQVGRRAGIGSQIVQRPVCLLCHAAGELGSSLDGSKI